MLRLANMIGWDLTLQAKNYIIVMNLVSTAVLAAFIALLQPPLPTSLASFFIFADPALIGLSLIGAIVLMEKAARVLFALGVTPSPAWVYVASKAFTMTLMGTCSALAVAWVAHVGEVNWPLMVLAAVMSNLFAVLIGFACVARAPSMNVLVTYLLVTTTALFAALPAHFGLTPDWLKAVSMLIPSYAILLALDGAAAPHLLTPLDWAYAYGYQGLWILIGWRWALREFNAQIVSEGR